MESTSLISVLCLSMNHGDFIEHSFNSLVSQTYQDFEILYVDNNSADDSFEKGYKILETSGLPFKAFKREKNYGTSENLNYLISFANGTYLAPLSADDWWHKDNLKIKASYLKKNAHVGLLHGYGFIHNYDQNKIFPEEIISKRSGWVLKYILKRNFINSIGVILKTDCVKNVGGYDNLSVLEDWDMYIRISEKYQIGYLDIPLVYYGKWSNNISNNRPYMNEGYRYIFKKFSHYPEINLARRFYELEEIYAKANLKADYKNLFLLISNFTFTRLHVRQVIKCFLRATFA